ncbi:MAG: hypothetical protein KZQ87_17440, partial [Candidatus Thiodiazotropha sp. (ex Cardiolucina cf. quadrata)]|nr:hypothetical protein [Candidatus Thiodiazotropha sp. (ex Cardiolucina cf. quadrata)]
DLSYNEYNPLFMRNGMALQLDVSVADNDTWSNDAIVAGLFDNLAFSVGQFHTETENLREDINYEQDIINGFVQFSLTEGTSVQLEASESEEDKGDASQRLIPEFSNNDTIKITNEVSTIRAGLSHSLNNDTTVLLNSVRREQDFFSTDSTNPFVIVETDIDRSIDLYEAQVTNKQEKLAWLAGISRQAEERESVLDAIYLPPLSCPLPSCVIATQEDVNQLRLYGYLYYEASPMLSLTGGITHLREKREADDDVEKIYPKLGLRVEPETGGVFRLAAFRNRVSVLRTSFYETLEPTQITSFNQLYDDIDQTDSWNYAASYDQRFSKNFQAGISTLHRELETTIDIQETSSIPPTRSSEDLEYDDKYANLWLNWAPSSHWALGLSYSYNRYNLEKELTSSRSSILAPDGILKLESHKLPASISYFHSSGLIGKLTTTYYDQKGKFIDRTGFNILQGEDHGFITDLTFSYRFTKRRGSVSLGIKNLFDETLNQEDRNSYDATDPASSASPSSFTSERAVFGKISLNFR